MHTLDHFSVPYLGLDGGKHTFRFEVDDAFWAEFEDSLIQKGNFTVTLDLDKRPDMGIAEFFFEGEAHVECDRCLSPLILDLYDEFKYHIKIGEVELVDDEIMVLLPETSSIQFAQVIYEAICLSLPMIKVHDFESDCDQVMINKLHDQPQDDEDNVWKGLKGLNLD